MRRFLIFFSAAVVLVVAMVAILPFVIPVDTYRSEIEARATEATGRQLTIGGKLRLTIFPELGVEAGKVTLANVPGGHAPYFAAMDDLRVGVKLLPLLSGRVEVSQITLDKPTINLEADKSGKGNWLLGGKNKATSPETGGMSARASFEGIRIRNGRIAYRNDATGTNRVLDDIDLDVALTSFSEPLSIDGSLVTNGQKISFDGKIASPQMLMNSEPSAVDLSLTSDLLQASFKGSLAGSENADGMLKLDTPSLRKLAAWAGKPLPPGGGLGHLSLEGKLSAKGKRDDFSAIKLVLDRMTLTGALSIDRSATVPFLSGTLAVDRLDLNPYLSTSGSDSSKPQTPPAGSGWSTKPLDFSVLKTMNAKLSLATGSLAVRQLKAGKTQVGMTLDNGRLNATLAMGNIYGGSGNAVIAVDAHDTVPRISNNAHFEGLAVKSFLNDTLGVSRIEGTGEMTMDVTAAGKSPNAIMHALAGKGAVVFRNGRIRGVDLASVARTIQSALSGSAIGGGASTDFTEMGGTFTIAGGVMTNKDLHLLSPFFRMTGAGNINLGEQTIDFVVSPKAVTSIKGQGGEQNARGIGIPFRIYGPWSHIHYSPDLSGVANDILQSIKNGGFSGKNVLRGLFGGQNQSQTDQPQQNQPKKKPTPLDALKGLFGGH